jgi:hypothetical protein
MMKVYFFLINNYQTLQLFRPKYKKRGRLKSQTSSFMSYREIDTLLEMEH